MGIVNKVTNLVALQSGRRPATLGIILNSLSTKTEVKIITYNPLTSKYNVVFSGFAYNIYQVARDYLDAYSSIRGAATCIHSDIGEEVNHDKKIVEAFFHTIIFSVK